MKMCLIKHLNEKLITYLKQKEKNKANFWLKK